MTALDSFYLAEVRSTYARHGSKYFENCLGGSFRQSRQLCICITSPPPRKTGSTVALTCLLLLKKNIGSYCEKR